MLVVVRGGSGLYRTSSAPSIGYLVEEIGEGEWVGKLSECVVMGVSGSICHGIGIFCENS